MRSLNLNQEILNFYLIDDFNTEDKNIIVKYYLEEYTWREIAQQYCYSLSWIKKRAIQAIKQLSDMIFGIDVDILLI